MTTTIRLYADTGDTPPPGREWLARIERGTTATVVWGSSKAEARARAEEAGRADEARRARAQAAARKPGRAPTSTHDREPV